MQVAGLKQRLSILGSAKAVVGISGGLDSTLALLVSVEAMRRLGRPASDVCGVTMPCFGTSDRTYNNSWELMRTLGISCKEINIKDAVNLHFSDIGHDPNIHNGTYENSQARERTQILMDYASVVGGIVVGTGDLSELALGWCTYNGDHMSMYGVNASIPKTLIRWMIDAISEMPAFAPSRAVLQDILDTPISPELLPPDAEGKIAQHTEDLVGPYALHDFFLYYVLRFGFRPTKIYTLACRAFAGDFEPEVIKKWLKTFYRRFFTQQFKRSCLPDGVKVGSVTLSPRGDWRMPATPARDCGWTKLKVYNICKPRFDRTGGAIVYYNQKSMASPFRVRVFSAPRVRTWSGLGFALGDQVGENDARRVGAVGEGDLLNALVLQIAQRPEGAGEKWRRRPWLSGSERRPRFPPGASACCHPG